MTIPRPDRAGYPDDYRDPECDGSIAGFRNIIIPARTEALLRSLNSAYENVLPDGVRFEWESTAG